MLFTWHASLPLSPAHIISCKKYFVVVRFNQRELTNQSSENWQLSSLRLEWPTLHKLLGTLHLIWSSINFFAKLSKKQYQKDVHVISWNRSSYCHVWRIFMVFNKKIQVKVIKCRYPLPTPEIIFWKASIKHLQVEVALPKCYIDRHKHVRLSSLLW